MGEGDDNTQGRTQRTPAPDELAPDEPAPGEPAAATPARPCRRGRALVIVLVLLAGLAALILAAPGPVARLVAADQLATLGIAAEGVETLEISPWHRRIALGPVRFRQGDGAYGRLEHVSVHVSLQQLIHRRLLIKDVRIQGLDVAIVQGQDGTLFLNGIPLPAGHDAPDQAAPDQAAPDQAAPDQAAPDQQAESDASSWAAGLNSLDVRDSRLAWTAAGGGTLAAVIERLTLAGFRPWEQDSPGVVALTARLNDIGLDVHGEARPFAEARHGRFEINLADASLARADLARIEGFTGPLGLARSAGRIALAVRGTVTASPEGGIALDAAGRADLKGLDLATADGLAAAAAALGLDFELRGTFGGDGRAAASGSARLDLTAGDLAAGDGTTLQLPSARITVADLALAAAADGGLRITGTPELAVDRPAINGPARLACDGIGAKLAATNLDLGTEALTLSAKPSLRLDGLRMEEPLRLAAAAVNLDLGELALDAAGGTTSLDIAGAARIERFALAGATELSGERITLDLPTLALHARADGLDVQATGKLDIAPAALVLKGGGDAHDLRADAAALGLAFRDLSVRQTAAETAIGAVLRLDAGTLKAALPYDGAEAALGFETVTIALEPLTVTETALRTALAMRGTAEIGGIGAEMPAVAGAPAISAAIATVQLALAGLDVTLAGDAPRIEARFETTHEELTAAIGGGELARARLATLSLTGGRLAVDGALAADALVLRKPDVELNDRLFAAFASAPAGRPAPPAAQGAPSTAPSPRLALGRVAVADGGTLVFLDGSVRPPLRLKTEIKVLEAQGLDTGDPARQTDLKLDSVVNDFSKVQLLGWVQPFAKVPNFDLNGRIGDLELPAFSPYAAQTVGLNLEKGRLSARLDARASGGALAGRADFDVDNLGFSALSKDDAERLSAKMGVPIETVVGLLQDSRGRIELGIPVSGDLRSPEFDLSQAIGRAVSGAITAAVTAPFQLLYQPVALVAGAAGAGSRVALKPVLFAPGETRLDTTAAAFIDGVAKMLKERPRIGLQTCGRATSADLDAGLARPPASGAAPPPAAADRKAAVEAMRPALQTLAVERGRAVRRQLVEQGGIRADRIGECRSAFDAADRGPPRAEFSF